MTDLFQTMKNEISQISPELSPEETAPLITCSDLISMFSHESWIIRKSASDRIIMEIGEDALPELIPLLISEQEDNRYWSIRTMGRLGEKGIKILCEKLQENNEKNTLHIISSLGNSGSWISVDPLISLLSSSDWLIRKTASEALIKLKKFSLVPLAEKIKTAEEETVHWIIILLGKMGKSALVPLLKYIRSENRKIRLASAKALGILGDPHCLKSLIHLLCDESAQVQKAAFQAILEFNTLSVKPLISAINSGNPLIVKWSMKALIKLGPPVIPDLISIMNNDRFYYPELIEKIISEFHHSAFSTLCILTKNENPDVRSAAVSLLPLTECKEILETLCPLLSDSEWKVRNSACEAILTLPHPEIRQLTNLLYTDNSHSRFHAAKILSFNKKFNDIEKLLKDGPLPVKMEILTAIQGISVNELSGILIDLLKSNEWKIRKLSAECLKNNGILGIDALLKAVHEGNQDIKYWISQIIEEIGIEAIAPLIETLKTSSDSQMRAFAAYSLAQIKSPNSWEPLLKAMTSDSEPWVRKYAASGLANLNPAKAPEFLIPLLVDQSEEFYQWIIQLLKKTPPTPLTLKLLTEGFHSRNHNKAILCARAMADLKITDGMEFLIELLQNTDDKKLEIASTGLTTFGKKAIEPLIMALEHESWILRKNASELLEKFGYSVLEPLERLTPHLKGEKKYSALSLLNKLSRKYQKK